MTPESPYCDAAGWIRVHDRPSDLVLGPDNRLLGLHHRLARMARGDLPSKEHVTANLLLDLGLFRSAHLIDCRSRDPADYRLRFIGADAQLEGGTRFQGSRFREAEWSALTAFVADEYSRVIARRAPDLADIEYIHRGRYCAYRRVVIPLRNDQGKADHLLVAFRYHPERISQN